jgi:L-alanine-DL-glutamate epimerase-like enolase superfamily enzyme
MCSALNAVNDGTSFAYSSSGEGFATRTRMAASNLSKENDIRSPNRPGNASAPRDRHSIAVDRIEVAAYTIPTDAPESDGTLEWDDTTMVAVHAAAGGVTGFGYTYASSAAGRIIESMLAGIVSGRDAMDVEACYVAMRQGVRNIGRDGVAASAISAVDIALWDLKARLLDISVVALVGAARDSVAVYGSGGFTSYSIERLQEQLAKWVNDGIGAVKMKIGRDPIADRDRVRAARQAIGPAPQLFVDANGAYTRKQALAQAEDFVRHDVSWFEEPVSSDDLEGLRLMRDRAPGGMDIAAGEYGYDVQYFRRLAEAGAVDVLQADATRCGGVTGFLRAAAVCDAFGLPLSSHTAPGVHAHLCCAAARTKNLEYFHDHVRIERLLFEGALLPVGGALRPDRSRPGFGLELKRADAERFRV